MLVRCALAQDADYWTGLALGWLEHGFPAAGLIDDLAALKDAPGRGQPIRHRALRVYRVSVAAVFGPGQ
ncbi:hypothetical protein ACQP00_33110 [Dactylosporangium sp. CS-047395]|uniref:hypothetical protein n=1 Tax=Dactylosporangium sp. CS-047395 TaxID=3239936 RepID=UPI003D8B2FA8